MKRIFDLFVAAFLLLLVSPVLLVVAILIKIDSSGPVFFRQARVGRAGELFRIFKFRTMVLKADQMGSRLTTKRDPRVTRVGQALRWFKIDELPQLINVVAGEMSLIGPRPEDPYFVEFYDEAQREVLSVCPGMLGAMQILGRDELDGYPEGVLDTETFYVEHILPEKLAGDLEYVRHATFWGDAALLARGVWAVAYGAVKAKFLWQRRYRIALFFLDAILVGVSWYLAFMIRYDFELTVRTQFLLYPTLIMVAVRSVTLAYMGAYQAVLAFFGVWDAKVVFQAISASSIIGAGLIYFVGFQSFPRSVFVIDWAVCLMLIGGLRFVLRWLSRRRVAWRRRARRENAIVVGSGLGGEQIARSLIDDPLSSYRPVGFIDEQPDRWGALIHGIRVLGGPADLPLAISANDVEAVFVCVSELSERSLIEVVDACKKVGVEYRVVPTLSDLLNRGAGVASLGSGEIPAAETNGTRRHAATG